MANQSFVTPKTGVGFERYTDIVREILQAHKTIQDGLFTAAGASPKVDVVDAYEIICNLTLPDQTGPTGYNIDEDGDTQVELMSTFKTLRDSITQTKARTTADGIFQAAVRKLQKHLKALIDDTDNTLYASVSDYYNQNINWSHRSFGGTHNLLNGGYYFNASWQRMSTAAGVTYSTSYDSET